MSSASEPVVRRLKDAALHYRQVYRTCSVDTPSIPSGHIRWALCYLADQYDRVTTYLNVTQDDSQYQDYPYTVCQFVDLYICVLFSDPKWFDTLQCYPNRIIADSFRHTKACDGKDTQRSLQGTKINLEQFELLIQDYYPTGQQSIVTEEVLAYLSSRNQEGESKDATMSDYRQRKACFEPMGLDGNILSAIFIPLNEPTDHTFDDLDVSIQQGAIQEYPPPIQKVEGHMERHEVPVISHEDLKLFNKPFVEGKVDKKGHGVKKAITCSVSADSVCSNLDLTLSARDTDNTTGFGVRFGLSEQLPAFILSNMSKGKGGNVTAHPENLNYWEVLFSPSNCENIKVRQVVSDTIPREDHEMLQRWSPIRIPRDVKKHHDAQVPPQYLLLELELTLKSGKIGLCVRRPPIEHLISSTPSLDRIVNARKLKVFVYTNYASTIDVIKNFIPALGYVQKTTGAANVSFPSYRRRGVKEDPRSLLSALQHEFHEKRTFPPYPSMLVGARKKNESKNAEDDSDTDDCDGAKNRKVFDMTSSVDLGLRTILIADVPQLCDVLALGVWRDKQMLKIERDVAVNLVHSAMVTPRWSDSVQRYTLLVTLNPGYDPKHAPPPGKSVKFIVKYLPGVQQNRPYHCHAVSPVGIVGEAGEDGRIVIECENLMQEDCRHFDECKHPNRQKWSCRIQLRTPAGAGALNRQLSALSRLQTSTPQSRLFNFSRILLTSTSTPDYTYSLAEHALETSPRRAESISKLSNMLKEKLNKEQAKAYDRCVEGAIDGYLQVVGPPGTGKTRVLDAILAAAQLYGANSIAACKSNRTVDMLFTRASKQTKRVKPRALLVRLFTRGQEHGFRRRILQDGLDAFNTGDYPDMPHVESSMAYIAMRMATFVDEGHVGLPPQIQDLADQIRRNDERRAAGLLLEDVPKEDIAALEQACEAAEMYVLETADFICGTIDSVADKGEDMKEEGIGKEFMVCDGVSQVTIPELLAAVINNQACKMLVVAGDGDQIGPQTSAAKAGRNEVAAVYNTSLFTKSSLRQDIVQTRPQQTVRLTKNYRNPKMIIDLVNKFVANNRDTAIELVAMAPENTKNVAMLQRLTEASSFRGSIFSCVDFNKHRVIFIDVKSPSTTTPSSNAEIIEYQTDDPTNRVEMALSARVGRYNVKGAQVIAKLVEAMREQGILADEIALMSMYKTDADKLAANLIQSDVSADGSPLATTVDKFQGDEAGICLVHLVSSNSSSYVGSRPRLVAAATRATSHCIIVGDIEDHLNNNPSRSMKVLMKFVKEEGAIVKWPEDEEIVMQDAADDYGTNDRGGYNLSGPAAQRSHGHVHRGRGGSALNAFGGDRVGEFGGEFQDARVAFAGGLGGGYGGGFQGGRGGSAGGRDGSGRNVAGNPRNQNRSAPDRGPVSRPRDRPGYRGRSHGTGNKGGAR